MTASASVVRRAVSRADRAARSRMPARRAVGVGENERLVEEITGPFWVTGAEPSVAPPWNCHLTRLMSPVPALVDQSGVVGGDTPACAGRDATGAQRPASGGSGGTVPRSRGRFRAWSSCSRSKARRISFAVDVAAAVHPDARGNTFGVDADRDRDVGVPGDRGRRRSEAEARRDDRVEVVTSDRGIDALVAGEPAGRARGRRGTRAR